MNTKVMKSRGAWTEIRKVRSWLVWAFVSGVGSAGIVGCESHVSEPTGGETHFLRVCDPLDYPCAGEFSCLCGVCTTPCDVNMPCSDHPGAQCVTLDEVACETSAAGACDVGCGADEDCKMLSSGHHCIDGFCRLAGGASTAEGGSGATTGSPPPCEDSGTTGNEVVILGDSFFATTHEITGHLESLARSEGVLSEGERYRDSSNLLSNSLAFPEAGIRMQYENARTESAVKVVIMNGGGADLLLGSCEIQGEQCPLMTDAALALQTLLQLMNDEGVEQVVFVGYPDPLVNEVREKMDVLRPLLEQACADSAVPCEWLDLRPVFSEEPSFIDTDGLNPTSAGAEATAEALFQLMQARCIAQ